MYESFYLRAVSPDAPLGVWIRNTVHKRPGHSARGSVWCTVFDPSRGQPLMHKLTSDELRAPEDGWIAIADEPAAGTTASGEGAFMAPGQARGRCGEASWTLSWRSSEHELCHLSSPLLYRAALPRTKLTSPAPLARFDGRLELAGQAIEIRAWPGMVGHNWGSEHAERWIWLHGANFEQAPEAWLDVALGRVKLGRWTTPWVANGALSLDGHRHRIGGLGARGLRVAETPLECTLLLPAEAGVRIETRVRVPGGSAAGWRYADPDGGSHDVVNCSIASLELDVMPGGQRPPRALRTEHGGAYELGMRERDHEVPIAPFPDG